VPFVLYKISSLDEATKKWSTPGYLSKAFDKKMLDVETCNTSHFQVRDPCDFRALPLRVYSHL
jgi:hypothetical protein